MKDYTNIVKQPVDIFKILKELDISQETLSQAALTQGRLYMEAARFYVQAIKNAAQAKARLEERKADRAQYFRKRGMKKTEGQVKELVALSPSVKKLQIKCIEADEKEQYGKLLLEALKMRRDAIRILSEVVEDEARSELRLMKEKKAKRELQEVKNRLSHKYREEEEGEY